MMTAWIAASRFGLSVTTPITANYACCSTNPAGCCVGANSEISWANSGQTQKGPPKWASDTS